MLTPLFLLVSIICFHVASDSIISTVVFIRHLVSRHPPLLLLVLLLHLLILPRHLRDLVLITTWDAGERPNADSPADNLGAFERQRQAISDSCGQQIPAWKCGTFFFLKDVDKTNKSLISCPVRSLPQLILLMC